MSTQPMEPKAMPHSRLVSIDTYDQAVRKQLEEERERLEREAGIARREVHQFKRPVERPFTKDQRAHTTLLFGGLTWKHEKLIHGALEGLGYKAEAMPTPDVRAFQTGKEYGNNGQCNPTYFTVGNLVQYLQGLEAKGSAGRRSRQLRLLHRRRLRPLPLRHVRGRVPAGAAELRLRRLPRAAVPAVRRPEPVGRRSRAGDEPRLLPGHPERAELRRRAQRGRLRTSGRTRCSRARPTRVLDEAMDYMHEVFRDASSRGSSRASLGALPGRLLRHGRVHRQVRQPARRATTTPRALAALPRRVRRDRSGPPAREAHRQDHRRVLGADHRGRRQLQHVPLPGARGRAGAGGADRHLDHVHAPPGGAEIQRPARASRRAPRCRRSGRSASAPRIEWSYRQQGGQAQAGRGDLQARVPQASSRRWAASRTTSRTSTSCSASAIPSTTRARAAARAISKSPRTSTTRTRTSPTWCCR